MCKLKIAKGITRERESGRPGNIMVAEKGHQQWVRANAIALAAAKCSIHPVHCNSVPYEFPNQIK